MNNQEISQKEPIEQFLTIKKPESRSFKRDKKLTVRGELEIDVSENGTTYVWFWTDGQALPTRIATYYRFKDHHEAVFDDTKSLRSLYNHLFSNGNRWTVPNLGEFFSAIGAN